MKESENEWENVFIPKRRTKNNRINKKIQWIVEDAELKNCAEESRYSAKR